MCDDPASDTYLVLDEREHLFEVGGSEKNSRGYSSSNLVNYSFLKMYKNISINLFPPFLGCSYFVENC